MSSEEVAVPVAAPVADPLPVEPRRPPLTRTFEVPARQAKCIPASATVVWGRGVTNTDGSRESSCPTSVTVVWGAEDPVDDDGYSEVYRRGPGELALPPAANLKDAASRLVECKTYEQVVVLATELLALGPVFSGEE